MHSTVTSPQYRIEVYLRGDTYGTYDAQKRVLDRLDALQEEGTLEVVGCTEWDGVRTMEYDSRDGALATYEEFREWARNNDAQLEPAFQQRIQSYIGQTAATEIVVFPVVCLALYSGDELVTVCPSTVDGEHVTVHDCLDALGAGHVERFLARFTPYRVDRTEPLLEQPTV